MQTIEFAHENERLTGTLFVPKNTTTPSPGVIFFPGMTSSEKKYLPMAQQLSEHGITALTIHIRGHGDSGGQIETLTGADFETDGIATYDFFIKQRNIDPQRIGICGGSFGGLLAAVISEQRAVKSLVLRAPAAYTEKMRHLNMGELVNSEQSIFYDALPDLDQALSLKAMQTFTGSVLVMACEQDKIIPLEMAKAFHDQAVIAKDRKFEIIQGAEHSLQSEAIRTQFSSRITDWFLDTL